MAGHSKWANIKHRKAVVDARRGKLFTKASKAIIVAARLGGGDPDGNARLRMAIENAKAVSLAADNIKRAIQRGIGEIEGAVYEDVTYEGYGPGGVAIIVECTTENRNRTVQEVRATFSKYGGNLGEMNSVSWNFTRRGEIRVDTTQAEDAVLELAIAAGADDVQMIEEDGVPQGALVSCSVAEIQVVSTNLQQEGLSVGEQLLVYAPNTTIEVSDPDHVKKLVKMLEVFEDNDDVQNVFQNAEIDDSLL